MLRQVHASNSNKEIGDAVDVGAEIDRGIEINETGNSVSNVDNFNEPIENNNVSGNTAIPFPVTHWLIW